MHNKIWADRIGDNRDGQYSEESGNIKGIAKTGRAWNEAPFLH